MQMLAHHVMLALCGAHPRPVTYCNAAGFAEQSGMLQRLPFISCIVTIISIAFILYALSTPQGLKLDTLTPQGAIVVVCACGMAVCIYTCLVAPCSIKRFGYAIRPEAQIRRMNLLGLVCCFPLLLCCISFNT